MGFWTEKMYQKYLKLNSDENVISFGKCLNFTKITRKHQNTIILRKSGY